MTNANNNLIRFLAVPSRISPDPQNSFNAAWVVSSDSVVPRISAIAVMFSQRVQPAIGVPLGIIIAANGSTSVECWVSEASMSNEFFQSTMTCWNDFLANWEAEKAAMLQTRLNQHLATPTTLAAYDMPNPSTSTQIYPTLAYNGILHPLFPFSLKGVLWRQGEANASRAVQYRDLLPVMIDEWRTNFENPDMPFLQAQLPEWGSTATVPRSSSTAEMRESQYLLTQTQTNVEVAILIDEDTGGATHSPNKQVDAYRLAALALGKVYNQTNLPYQGPIYRGMQVEGSAIRIAFDYVYEGLMIGDRESFTSLVVTNTPDAPIANFSIAGEDQVFHWATATIDGTNIVVQSDSVPNPVAVRYAWDNNPVGCNLYNNEGFPAAPFRTDNWPLTTQGAVTPALNYFISLLSQRLNVKLT